MSPTSIRFSETGFVGFAKSNTPALVCRWQLYKSSY